MTEATSDTTGRSSLTLARGDELTVVLTVLKTGHALDEHPAPAAASVTCLDGNITFTTHADEITLERVRQSSSPATCFTCLRQRR